MNYPGLNKGDILENIFIEKLIFGGTGKATLSHPNPDHDGKTILISGGAIPESVVNLRVLRKKKRFIEVQIVDIIKKSPYEQQHPTNPYGWAGAWKWINIPYEKQLTIKDAQVREAFFTLEKEYGALPFSPIFSSPHIDAYRNKTEFSFGKYISHKEGVEEPFNVGFHKQGEFSKIIDFEGTPLIDDEQNEIFREVKKFSKTLGLPVYDQKTQKGFFRHLLLRKANFTSEIMLVLSFNPAYFSENTKLSRSEKLEKIQAFLLELAEKYPNIVSIYFSHNTNKSDTAIGELEHIYGKKTITETLHGLDFEISPSSFFQTNSQGAQKLYQLVLDVAKEKNYATVLDLYGGTGTIGMIFAKNGAERVVSVELSSSASQDGVKNAQKNAVENIEFVNAKVEDFLETFLETNQKADLLIIDPPRAGMHPKALEDILKFGTDQMIYVSCNPATLARDVAFILKNSDYTIEKIQAMDMFPHTHHIETVVSFVKNKS